MSVENNDTHTSIADSTPPSSPNSEGETAISPIDEAKQILVENAKLLEELKEERKKIEKATASIMISGKGFSNIVQEKKEETPKEYKDRIMRGIV